VIAPAKTGRDKRSKMAVTNTDQGNRDMRSITIPTARKLAKVVIKFTAPSKEETPAKCKEKIAKSTDAPA